MSSLQDVVFLEKVGFFFFLVFAFFIFSFKTQNRTQHVVKFLYCIATDMLPYLAQHHSPKAKPSRPARRGLVPDP